MHQSPQERSSCLGGGGGRTWAEGQSRSFDSRCSFRDQQHSSQHTSGCERSSDPPPPPPTQSRFEQHAAVTERQVARRWRRREHRALNLRGLFSAQVRLPDAPLVAKILARSLPKRHFRVRRSTCGESSPACLLGEPVIDFRRGFRVI